MKTVVEKIATSQNVTKKLAKELVDSVIEAMGQELVANGELRTALGTFKVKTRAARKGRNPKTGAELQIAESKTVGFKVSKSIKESL